MDCRGNFSLGAQKGERTQDGKQKCDAQVLNPFYQPSHSPNVSFLSSSSVHSSQSNKAIYKRHGYIKNHFQTNGTTQTSHINQYKIQNYSTSSNTDTSINEKIGSGFRQWQIVKNLKSKLNEKSITFRVMSFNVLAQLLLERHPELYYKNSKSCLPWKIRFENIYNEIRRHSCDILCLQEVQQNHLDDYYRKHLKNLGYNTIIYKRRTGDCPDGCAIFYNPNVFTLIDSETVEFNQPNVNILNRNNIGLIAKFSPVGFENCPFIVATTHLLYNPKRDDIRLAQMQLFLAEIDRMAFNVSHHMPIILTGDLNSLHDSPPLQLISTANMPLNQLQKANDVLIPYHLGISDNCQHVRLVAARQKEPYISRELQRKYVHLYHRDYPKNNEKLTENINLLNNTGCLTHSFAFKSVYDQPTKEATTFQNRWVTVDYIFYSGRRGPGKNKQNAFKEEKLILLSRYSLPLRTNMTSVSIPNRYLGSDHLSLMAEFKLQL